MRLIKIYDPRFMNKIPLLQSAKNSANYFAHREKTKGCLSFRNSRLSFLFSPEKPPRDECSLIKKEYRSHHVKLSTSNNTSSITSACAMCEPPLARDINGRSHATTINLIYTFANLSWRVFIVLKIV